jgi:uncharacterized repeat protein (TIGR01451 family)
MSVNGESVSPSREPDVDITPLNNITRTPTDAIYDFSPTNKIPVVVNVGDKILYKMRIYNECDISGYATMVEDYLPEWLEMVPPAESSINTDYGWEADSTGRIIRTDYLSDKLIDAFDGTTLDYEDLEIECRIKEGATLGKVQTNIAQIISFTDEEGNPIEDRDSKGDNAPQPDGEDLEEYPNGWTDTTNDKREDDDDYEKVEIYKPGYDLALRKFITRVNDLDYDGTKSREPVVDIGKLTDADKTNDKLAYSHAKVPVNVKTGDYVIYTIRVYNEGETDAYCEEIMDDVPEGLEFDAMHPINIQYEWELQPDGIVVTRYLSEANDENYTDDNGESSMLAPFDGTHTPDYKDVKVALKVIADNTHKEVIKNTAEITNDNGDDDDSTPDNLIDTEDDIDNEYVKVGYFDLSLIKYITSLENKEGTILSLNTEDGVVTDRKPTIEENADGTVNYIHPAPVIVTDGNLVTYTLTITNQGTLDGYAEEIIDDIPEGLVFVPSHEINQEYKWEMLDKDKNVTTSVADAKYVLTKYIYSSNPSNIIKGTDGTTYYSKDVLVVFEVVKENIPEEDKENPIVNTAEIKDDSDDDIDSVPGNNVPHEDDIDKEAVVLKEFDLELIKWVSRSALTIDGQKVETAYNKPEDDPGSEYLVKIDIGDMSIETAELKFEYTIEVINAGDIDGFALEISDYIPEGLMFVQDDNPTWQKLSDGTITTDELKDELLGPGESATVKLVLTWINGHTNFGDKRNWAEISKDDNAYEAEDIDSEPGNASKTEDDDDFADVIVTEKTGRATIITELLISTTGLAIIACGLYVIKRFIL